MAMLWLIAPWAIGQGIAVSVATVDHGLRPESRAEAEFVAQTCVVIGVPHTILAWHGWDGRGNLSAAARDARRMLLTDWAKQNGIDTVVLGHTMDDQAETVLMRLGRGSGVDGLSAMSAERTFDGLRWLRPLLSQRREDLRLYLRRHDRAWVDDPTNTDDHYDRVKARKALAVLEPLGIDADGLEATAARMSMAREALSKFAAQAARQIVTIKGGNVVIDRAGFVDLPQETQLRLAAHAICWVGGSPYRPRLNALKEALADMLLRKRRTLQGAVLSAQRGSLVVSRELNAIRGATTPTTAVWDSRWQLDGPHAPDFQIRALGEAGIRQCPDWRGSGIPRQSFLASPAIWQGDTLIAAPLVGKSNGWTARIVTDFHDSLLSH